MVGGGVRGSTCLGDAGGLKTCGKSTQWSDVRGGAKGLKRTSGSGADGLAEFERGGGRWSLGGNLGDTNYFVLDGTSGGTSTAVGVWVGLPYVPSNSTKKPTGTDNVASSRTESDVSRGSGSRVMVGSVLL